MSSLASTHQTVTKLVKSLDFLRLLFSSEIGLRLLLGDLDEMFSQIAMVTLLGPQVYGLGGVGLVLEVLTDNNNRAAANIRDVVKKGGGKMADPGSVLFNFKRTGVVYVKTGDISSDDLLLAAMDAGAEDVLEPEVDEDEDDEETR